MALGKFPYSRQDEAVKAPEKDDDPSRLPETEWKSAYQPFPKQNIQDATDDVGGAIWGQSETYRRLNCRGKDN